VTPYTVVFAPEAEDNLVELYEYISEHGSPALAQRYADAIVTHCESLATFPLRGTRRGRPARFPFRLCGRQPCGIS
jgi:plasmid stabilization system protein ParE